MESAEEPWPSNLKNKIFVSNLSKELIVGLNKAYFLQYSNSLTDCSIIFVVYTVQYSTLSH